MINFAYLQDAVYDWIKSESGHETFWDEQNAPEQNRPYFLANIVSGNAIGHDYIGSPSVVSGHGQIIGDREVTVDIQHFGDTKEGCLTALESLMSSLEKPTVQEYLCAKGIAFVSREPVRDISELLDKRFKYKAQSEVRFRIAQEFDDHLGVIQKVALEENSVSLSTITIHRLISEGD